MSIVTSYRNYTALGLQTVYNLTCVAQLFRIRSGNVGNTPEGRVILCGHLF